MMAICYHHKTSQNPSLMSIAYRNTLFLLNPTVARQLPTVVISYVTTMIRSNSTVTSDTLQKYKFPIDQPMTNNTYSTPFAGRYPENGKFHWSTREGKAITMGNKCAHWLGVADYVGVHSFIHSPSPRPSPLKHSFGFGLCIHSFIFSFIERWQKCENTGAEWQSKTLDR